MIRPRAGRPESGPSDNPSLGAGGQGRPGEPNYLGPLWSPPVAQKRPKSTVDKIIKDFKSNILDGSCVPALVAVPRSEISRGCSIMMAAGIDVSGNTIEGQYKYMGMVIGTQESLESIIKKLELEKYSPGAIKQTLVRQELISKLSFDGKIILPFA